MSLCEEDLKIVKFTRYKDGINDFDYEYNIGEMPLFAGRVTPLSDRIPGLFLLVGANATFYWVKFSNDELYKQNSFEKLVRSVEIHTERDILADLKDDFVYYKVFNNGNVTGGPYNPDWDLKNVSFILADVKAKVFNYTVFSKNNQRQVVGKTSYDKSPRVQTIHLPHRHECYSYEAYFTNKELASIKHIYKKVTQILKCKPPSQPKGTTSEEIASNL
ncbi:uncharacterized protein LOC116344892 [Contarinia nasturtii]|uniref:uncharacterized protein LOC116344892 n=1 Tax=Contarinia nasturtii TaxID=265458 RepID=UPI0012D3D086|nr:uncharacterized protein LOC116344892 [Contarinia nasturtii]